jgi:hypothetical protein
MWKQAHHTNLYQSYRVIYIEGSFEEMSLLKQTSMHILDLVLTHNILLYTTLSYPVSSVVHFVNKHNIALCYQF